MTRLIFTIILGGLFLFADSANILALNTVTSHSHTIYANVLTRALAARGHKLVVLSPDEERHKNPNITTIFLEGGYDEEVLNMKLEDIPPSESAIDCTLEIYSYSESQCRILLFSEGNKRFYREYKNHKFDLILMDTGVAECFLKYAHVFGNPPIVTFTAFTGIQPENLGNFDNPSYVPHFMSTLTDRMTFTERLENWFQYHFYALTRRYWLLPKLDKISEEFFGFYEPTIEELESKIQIALTNEHFSITHPKPMVPATVPVGGLHIKPPKPLPRDVEEFVSKAEFGVIFFSLGSNFLSKHMSDERKQLFLKAFAQLPQKVLWKYEDDTLKNIPKNVLIKKWFPQSDILGHNNTVLFISHNGFLSTLESIYFGIPIIGVPLFVDQYKNNAKIVRQGLGVRLELREIKTSEQILNKIKTVLNNPSKRATPSRRQVTRINDTATRGNDNGN